MRGRGSRRSGAATASKARTPSATPSAPQPTSPAGASPRSLHNDPYLAGPYDTSARVGPEEQQLPTPLPRDVIMESRAWSPSADHDPFEESQRRPETVDVGGDAHDPSEQNVEPVETPHVSVAASLEPQRHCGFCSQLLVTIMRMLLLLIRSPFSFACELLVPVIFAVGSIALWLIIARSSTAAQEYFSVAAESTTAMTVTMAESMLCYNATLTGGTAIANFPECTPFIANFAVPPLLLCSTSVATGAPFGLCVTKDAATQTYATLRSVIPSNTTKVPSFDDMIILQWVWRIFYHLNGEPTLQSHTVDAALFSTGALYFTPKSSATDALVAFLTQNSTYFQYIYGGTLTSVSDADTLAKGRTFRDPPIWGIVEVNSLTADDFDVAIRLNATALPQTSKILVDYYVGGLAESGSPLYILSGFTTLQQTLYTYYLTNVVGTTNVPNATLILFPEPTRAFDDKLFLAYGVDFVPLILVLSFLYPVSQMTKRIVLEKELRLRELMLIMGLSESVMYTGWFIIYLVQYTIISLVVATVLKITYLPQSSFGVIVLLIFIFCLTLISLSGLIAVFFSNARLSSILAPLVYFVLAIPLFAMRNSKPAARTGVSFLSPSGFAVGVKIIFQYEIGSGVTWSDVTSPTDSPNLSTVYVILLADFVIYSVLMLYLDAVLPRQWGTHRHPLFFIIEPVRWCLRRSEKPNRQNPKDGRAPDGVFENISDEDPSYAIRILGLRKEYRQGKHKFVAVDDLHWGMREGEISVLLGHNGAGKTTTMNMMTGMIEPDAGDCYIYGRSVREDIVKARQEIGFCPQQNVLWPCLTCYEHLRYYASVKGLRGDAREEAIDRILVAVDLDDKRNYRAAILSGGMKRKLSVAIAFVGGSRLIFLDEPTAGMDVGARRHTWTLLRNMSAQHSILLSTHFMDEADLLGDSIAIMSKGHLQCAGSNMFLKSKLGVGYVLTLSVVAHVRRAAIARVVLSHVPSATQLGSGAGEIAYRLPMATKAKFPDLLAAVEDHAKELGINAYSVSATTLEEIFIQIARQEEAKEEAERKRLLPAMTTESMASGPLTPPTEDASGNRTDPLSNLVAEDEATLPARHSDVWNVSHIVRRRDVFYSQFKAMLWKRFWISLRDRRTQFFQILCPVLSVLLAMILMLIKFFASPPITLSSDLYGTPVELDVVGCVPSLDLTLPFSSRAATVQPNGVTSAAGLSSFMLSTYSTHERERYNGLVCTDTSSFPLPNSATGQPISAVTYNVSALHSSAIGVHDLYNGYYMTNRNSAAKQLTTVVKTMSPTKTEDDVTSASYALIISIIVMIPFTFIPSTFVSWIVKERQFKARHLQNVSGLSFWVYWLTNFLYDTGSYIITMLLVIIVFAIFNRQEYVGKAAVGATFMLFFLYGISGVAMAYAVSFFFHDHATAQNVVMLGNFIAGFLLVLSVSMLSVLDTTKDVAKALRWVFRVVPSYCVGEGIGNLATLRMEEAFGTSKTPWSLSVVGWPCIYMAIEFPVFVAITLFVDHPGRRQRAQRLFHNADAAPEVIENEDEDVIAERNDVLNSVGRQSDLVRVTHLRKVYPNGKVAVRDLTFGVRPGEVFGFLGTNGAGKTTTISMLCQEFAPTSGHAAICGHDIVLESRKALRCIGYCPQFDATIDLLTVEEHLRLYAGVRGITYAERPRVVNGLLALCELTAYRNTLSTDLSGGNRRKLSVAISLIGGPSVVFLDEPSAGMDPVARRGLWTAIETVADSCSIVLTTHHLEEVEALAHRVAIMVDGALQCIGNKTHLKKKYGAGFEVHLRIQDDEEAVKERVHRFFALNFPTSRMREYRARRFTYVLPGDTKLSTTFKLLEENAVALGATDYSVSQTSIEQVFLQISEAAEARHDAEEAERLRNEDAGYRCTCCC